MLKQKQILIQSCVVELFVLVCKMVQQHESWEGTTMAKFTPFPLKSFNGQEMHWTQMCIELPKDDRISQKSLKPVANANTQPAGHGLVGTHARPRVPLWDVGVAPLASTYGTVCRRPPRAADRSMDCVSTRSVRLDLHSRELDRQAHAHRLVRTYTHPRAPPSTPEHP